MLQQLLVTETMLEFAYYIIELSMTSFSIHLLFHPDLIFIFLLIYYYTIITENYDYENDIQMIKLSSLIDFS